MNQKIILKSILVAAGVTLGLATSAHAVNDSTLVSGKPVATSADALGLLGQNYSGLSYSYDHLGNSPVSADRYGFEYNQPLNAGFDALFNYDWTQAGLLAGDRAHDQDLTAALRVFSTKLSWGRPYLDAGFGFDWQKVGGVNEHSSQWIGGAGFEFQATTALTLTPYVRYTRADNYSDKNLFNYGVKANYWLTPRFAVLAGIDRNDSQDMAYRVGFNTRF